MAFAKKTADDIQEAPRGNTILPDGWYQVAFQKVEARQAKSTQDMLSYTLKALKKEDDPSSVSGPALFGIVMFDSADDPEAWEASVAERTGAEGSELEEKIAERKRMAVDGAAEFGLAVFGYEEFSPTPRKCPETGKYLLPDGSEVAKYEDRQQYFKARKAEAYNAAVSVATGDTDITRYVCFAEVGTRTYNGKEQNEVKKLRPVLPAGKTLLKP